MKISELKNILKELISEEGMMSDELKSLVSFAEEHPTVIEQMKNWIKDCQWKDIEDESEVDKLPVTVILQGINKHYEGGVRQFMIDASPQPTAEGVGYVYSKDRAKDPKSIKTNGGTEHWRIKYQSSKDLSKHGNTEKSPVNEISSHTWMSKGQKVRVVFFNSATGKNEMQTGVISEPQQSQVIVRLDKTYKSIVLPWKYVAPVKEPIKEVSKGDLRNVIKELISEMWIGFQNQEEEQRDFMDHEKESVEPIKENDGNQSLQEIQKIVDTMERYTHKEDKNYKGIIAIQRLVDRLMQDQKTEVSVGGIKEDAPPEFGPTKKHSNIYKKVKSQYKGNPKAAYATMWKIHKNVDEISK